MTDTPIERLKGALEQWKCPSCGGAKVYTARWRDETAALQTSQVPCKVCEGSGLHPIARAALATIEPIPSAGEGERMACAYERAVALFRAYLRGMHEAGLITATHRAYSEETFSKQLREDIEALATLPSEPLRDD